MPPANKSLAWRYIYMTSQALDDVKILVLHETRATDGNMSKRSAHRLHQRCVLDTSQDRYTFRGMGRGAAIAAILFILASPYGSAAQVTLPRPSYLSPETSRSVDPTFWRNPRGSSPQRDLHTTS